jgi:hypothetical protein
MQCVLLSEESYTGQPNQTIDFNVKILICVRPFPVSEPLLIHDRFIIDVSGHALLIFHPFLDKNLLS